MDWREVWERKGSVDVGEHDLDTLIALDGFDAGTWAAYGTRVDQKDLALVVSGACATGKPLEQAMRPA